MMLVGVFRSCGNAIGRQGITLQYPPYYAVLSLLPACLYTGNWFHCRYLAGKHSSH